MSIDTERYAGELRDRLRLDGLRSDLEFPVVMASSRRAVRRRRAGIGGGVAAALALAVLASPVGLDAPALVADAMRSARLAHVEGLSGDLSEPLHVAWTAQGSLVGVVESDGTMLVSGGGTLRALASDGTERWAVRVGDDACSLRPDRFGSDAATADAEAVVLCGGFSGGQPRLLDPRSGAVLASLTIDWPSVLSLEPLGGDVIATGIDAQDHVLAARWHRDGSVVWEQTGPVLADIAGLKGGGLLDSLVVVRSGADVVRFDAATGDLVAGSGPVRTLRVELPGGYAVAQSQALDATGDGSIQAYAPDGTPSTTIPGHVRVPPVDDGSVPGLLVVQDRSTTRVWDLGGGTQLWDGGFVPAMMLDGRLIGWSTSSELCALDPRTGAVLWARPAPEADAGHGAVSAVTDGRTVLTFQDSGRATLVALDVETGAARWSVPWQGASVPLVVVPGGVLAGGDGTLTMLRP